jgi:hypothetical protein
MSFSKLSLKLKSRAAWKQPPESEQPYVSLLLCEWEKRYMELGRRCVG